jgi:hypothetical protein
MHQWFFLKLKPKEHTLYNMYEIFLKTKCQLFCQWCAYFPIPWNKKYKYTKLWYMYIISECPLHCVIRATSTVVEWRINICRPLVHWSWLLSSWVHSHRTAGGARGWLLYWSISHGVHNHFHHIVLVSPLFTLLALTRFQLFLFEFKLIFL